MLNTAAPLVKSCQYPIKTCAGKLPPPQLLPQPLLVTVTVKVCVLLQPAAFVYVAVYVPLVFAVTETWRDVELNPPEPLQLHDPPVTGCGPKVTVLPEVTLTLDVCCHAPPLTCMYGVIEVDVHPLPFTVTVNVCVLLQPLALV